ncbi:hypothetical protein KO529_04700 [Arenibacter algicola]|uniref:DUF6259 domain-containing protein n=1 Tax=Arenibacter algicola TaxID=616991 RepID=UPI001C0671E1|nr:DUF6259 domain-containing protein [Arenibacter algicola]MBU2904075.1 hypothetical protein [Arenibacter algicola]
MKLLNFFLILFFLVTGIHSQSTDKFQMETSVATLELNDEGEILITSKAEDEAKIGLRVNELWDITLVNKHNLRKERALTDISAFRTETSPQKLRFYAKELYIDDISTTVNAEFTIEVKNDSFLFSGNISCTTGEWIIKSLDYPRLSKMEVGKENTKIYWPDGLGQLFNSPTEFGTKKSLDYPSGWGTMPWFTLNSGNYGVYVGVHNPLQHNANITLGAMDGTFDFISNIHTPIYEADYTMPEFVVKPYKGTWHHAAKYYRSWYNENFKIASSPDWVINDTGWLLAILKQQNGNVMWPYRDIDQLCDIAKKFNLTTIGLFGWAVGGHDHLYPNYLPDPLMGGEKELKDAIKRAQDRGIKIILYANGKLIDTSTDYYRYRGMETMMFGNDKKPRMDFYVKHNNKSPEIFCWACTGSGYWRKTMHDLALQANSLGADGILFDQLGVLRPELCYSTYHDHKPGHGDSKYRLQLIREIREDLKEKNSNFVVMTEASNTSVLQEIDYTHGWGKAYAPSDNAFPDLYKYTFPEFMTTQRNGNPLLTKTDANFALLYGLKYEVETRYTADVEYLLKGKTPDADSYWNVNYPPDINKMKSLTMEESAKYVHSLIDFENTHGNFLKRGKFISDEGITITGKDVIARGFTNDNDDEMGVVVWNQNETEERSFKLSVPDYKYIRADDPLNQNVRQNSLLAPNSIRFLLFKKIN